MNIQRFIYLWLLSFIVDVNCVYAQAPTRMSYQAVITDTSDTPLPNTAIGMKISILMGTSTGSPVYVESHNTSTNGNGLVTLQVGAGTPVSGSVAGINWAAGPYFIKTETDPSGGTNYSLVGTSELLSVPYALYASNGGTPGFSTLMISASEPSGTNCSTGGRKVSYGLDNGEGGGSASNNVLEAGEIDGFYFVCNGLNGVNGMNGATGSTGSSGFTTLFTSTVETAGANCSAGGRKLTFGLDDGLPSGTARNGILETGEVEGTNYICNGSNGKTILNGTTDPLSTTGTDGDFYLNTTSRTLFGPKASSAWPAGVSLSGPQGPTGPTGATGATGPQGVIGVANFSGFIASIPKASTAYVFAGGTALISISAGQKLIGSASAPLGTLTGTTYGKIGLCYAPSPPGTPVLNFAGASYYSVATFDTERTIYSASFSISGLATGSYLVGFGVQNEGTENLSNNGSVNGWVMVVN